MAVHQLSKKAFNKIDSTVKLGTITHAPGNLWFFGIKIIHIKDFFISTNGYDMINSIKEYQISRHRRRKIDENLNSIENHTLSSINISIGRLGTTSIIFCSKFSSLMQQIEQKAMKKSLSAGLRHVKKIGEQQYHSINPTPAQPNKF